MTNQTYLHPASGTYSVIDLSLCDPSIFMDYNWKVLDNSWGSDHFSIILTNSKEIENHLLLMETKQSKLEGI